MKYRVIVESENLESGGSIYTVLYEGDDYDKAEAIVFALKKLKEALAN